MKRVTLILATFALLCLAAGQAQAHGHHGHHGYHGYHGGSRVVVHAPAWVGPRRFAPPPVYRPVYRPRYYYPAPSYGFYYQGRGVSVGVGF